MGMSRVETKRSMTNMSGTLLYICPGKKIYVVKDLLFSVFKKKKIFR